MLLGAFVGGLWGIQALTCFNKGCVYSLETDIQKITEAPTWEVEGNFQTKNWDFSFFLCRERQKPERLPSPCECCLKAVSTQTAFVFCPQGKRRLVPVCVLQYKESSLLCLAVKSEVCHKKILTSIKWW